MDIKHSRRILAVSAPGSSVLDVIKDLTGSAPPLNENGSTAGLSHEWDVQNAYYTAKVPIWIDEIADTEGWKTEFLKPEAKEVVEAVGAWIYCLPKRNDGRISKECEQTMKAIQDISETHAGYGADVVMLAVAPSRLGSSAGGEAAKQGDHEDTCLQYGFEYIDYGDEGVNEFGENVGFARLKEALEANDWADAGAGISESSLVDKEYLDPAVADDLDAGFGREEAEMTAELFGMKAALLGDGDDDFDPDFEAFEQPSGQQEKQVEDLDRLMGRLLAVKEQSEGLPEAQRKRMAAKAVRELMDE